jgi:hypothetical protein
MENQFYSFSIVSSFTYFYIAHWTLYCVSIFNATSIYFKALCFYLSWDILAKSAEETNSAASGPQAIEQPSLVSEF